MPPRSFFFSFLTFFFGNRRFVRTTHFELARMTTIAQSSRFFLLRAWLRGRKEQLFLSIFFLQVTLASPDEESSVAFVRFNLWYSERRHFFSSLFRKDKIGEFVCG